MQRNVVVLIADGFADSGLSILLDVLRTANAVAVHSRNEAPFAIAVASAQGGPIRAASGMVLAETKKIRAAAQADILVVPGLWAQSAAEVDAILTRADVSVLIAAIERAHARGAIVGSSCGGAFLLAECGLLDGVQCTTTWWLAPHLKKRRPLADVDADRALSVVDRVITAGAVFAQADLALYLVGRFAGPAAARHCSRLLLLDSHPSQAPYMAIQQLCANDATIRRAEAWVRRNLARSFDIADLGRGIGVTPRTLSRRLVSAVGVSPIGFVQRLRVETAVRLLETTRLSLQEVCERVGYQDANALRRLIQRETHASPRELRRRRGATFPRAAC